MSFLLSISRFDDLKKLQATIPRDEFESLRQSASGERIDLPGLKISVSKAVELLLLSMSSTDNKLTRTFTDVRLLLLRDSNC